MSIEDVMGIAFAEFLKFGYSECMPFQDYWFRFKDYYLERFDLNVKDKQRSDH